MSKKYQIDECPDAYGHWTIRPYDGSPNGDIYAEPIATFYDLHDAEYVVSLVNAQALSISAESCGEKL